MAAKATNGSAVALKASLSGQEIDGGNGVDVITADSLFTSSDSSKTYTIIAGNGDDTVWGSARNEIIWGDSSGNSTTSDNGADQLHGGGGADQIHGGNGDDKIWGDEGNDQLFGDNGADQLTGGLGGDSLTGGKGGDKFIYLLTSDSTANSDGTWNATSGDWIKDFNHSEGDKLDFSGFHDITGAGAPDELTWNGSNAGTYKIWSAGGFVYADTNGDGKADLAIKVDGTAVGGDDFIGINHAPVAKDDSGTTDEDHSIVLTSLANDSDPDGDALTITAASIGTGFGTATITNSGHTITYDPTSAYQYLAANETATVTINYTISDGHGGTASAVETVSVTGVNDVASISGDKTGGVTEDGALTVSGTLVVVDADHDQSHTRAVTASDHNSDSGLGSYSVDTDGHWSYTVDNSLIQHLAAGAHAYDTFTVTSTDGTASQQVTIEVTGVNDLASIGGDKAGSVTEDGTLIVSGTLVVSDADDNESHTQAVTASDHNSDSSLGSYSVDTDGHWSYTVDNSLIQHLAAGAHAYDTFTVTSTDATASQQVTIEITGVNDLASISGTATGDVTEDSPAQASGTLSVSDADDGQNIFLASDGGNHAGSYGAFAFDTATGQWTYTLDSSNAAVQALNDGDTLHDTYTVHSLDGTDDQLIDVTIHGATDVVTPPSAPPVFTGADPNDFDSLGNPAGTTITGGSSGGTTIYGGAGDDKINGNSNDDTIYAGSGNDTANGNNGGDTIYGGSGNDIILGSNGNDTIIGGYGADTLTGGTGNDNFVFLDTKDTGDTITDFKASGGADTIDFSALSAGTLNFVSGDSGNAVVANSVTWTVSGTDTIVSVDTTGDTTADLQITLTGSNLHLTASDFHL